MGGVTRRKHVNYEQQSHKRLANWQITTEDQGQCHTVLQGPGDEFSDEDQLNNLTFTEIATRTQNNEKMHTLNLFILSKVTWQIRNIWNVME